MVGRAFWFDALSAVATGSEEAIFYEPGLCRRARPRMGAC
jgi:hypothetical protein